MGRDAFGRAAFGRAAFCRMAFGRAAFGFGAKGAKGAKGILGLGVEEALCCCCCSCIVNEKYAKNRIILSIVIRKEVWTIRCVGEGRSIFAV